MATALSTVVNVRESTGPAKATDTPFGIWIHHSLLATGSTTRARWNRATCEQVLHELFSSVLETESERDIVDASIEEIEALNRSFDIPTQLSSLGVADDQVPAIVTGSAGNSMNGNPRPISNDELLDLLRRCR